MEKEKSPWLFVPTQYFAEGLPYNLVNNLSTTMYKSLGVSNELIGLTSLLYLPWSIKPLWSPFVDTFSTKRQWVVTLQLILTGLFTLIGISVFFEEFFIITIVIFALTAFVSATHDIATDGFYLYSLSKENQALFTGIRNTFYRVSTIFGSGVLVAIAGSFGNNISDLTTGWFLTFIISAFIFFGLFLYHRSALPYPETAGANTKQTAQSFKLAFSEYFKQKRIIVIISFILLFRFGEALLLKMAQPFLMDPLSKGGLGIGVADVGIIYGTVGILALLVGGILGGWLIKKYGLKKLIFPLALFMHLANLLYAYMAYFKPVMLWSVDFGWLINIFSSTENTFLHIYPIIQLCVVLGQFAYGVGFSAFMVYLLYTSNGEFKTSHYAISTGFMAVGMMLPGALSGILQVEIGYTWLFLLSFIATIPGMVLIFFLPYDE